MQKYRGKKSQLRVVTSHNWINRSNLTSLLEHSIQIAELNSIKRRTNMAAKFNATFASCTSNNSSVCPRKCNWRKSSRGLFDLWDGSLIRKSCDGFECEYEDGSENCHQIGRERKRWIEASARSGYFYRFRSEEPASCFRVQKVSSKIVHWISDMSAHKSWHEKSY